MSNKTTSQPDLWGDIELAGTRTPLVIMREQAALLGQKTKNVVKAKVNPGTTPGFLHYSFRLVVPALDGYNYELFSVRHRVEEPYPVMVETVTRNAPAPLGRAAIEKHLSNEAEFTSWLQRQLSSPKTKKIVATLFSQVAA